MLIPRKYLFIVIILLILIAIGGYTAYINSTTTDRSKIADNIPKSSIRTISPSESEPVFALYDKFMGYLSRVYQWVKDKDELLYILISTSKSDDVLIDDRFNYSKFMMNVFRGMDELMLQEILFAKQIYKLKIEKLKRGNHSYISDVPLLYYRVGSDYILVYMWSRCFGSFLSVLYYLDLKHNFLVRIDAVHNSERMYEIRHILESRYLSGLKPLPPANLTNASIRTIRFFIPLKNKDIGDIFRVASEVKKICDKIKETYEIINGTIIYNCSSPILEKLSNSSISFDPYILGHPWKFRVLRSSKVVDEGALAWGIYLYNPYTNKLWHPYEKIKNSS